MGFLSSLPNVQFKRVPVCFFGRDCFLQAWSLADQLEINRMRNSGVEESSLKAGVVGLLLALCDEHGNKLCSMADFDSLLTLPIGELNKYGEILSDLNKLPSTDDIEKN